MSDSSQEHIAVAVRVRPLNAREVSSAGRGLLSVDQSGRPFVLEVQPGFELFAPSGRKGVADSQFCVHLRYRCIVR